MSTTATSVVTANNVREYFLDAFTQATEHQDLAVDEPTRAYVVNLLANHCRASKLCRFTDDGAHHKPLALIYAEALDAPGAEQRNQTLRQLGDLALFVAGFFADSLNRKAVGIDYYIGMGTSAYASLHNSLQRSAAVPIHGDLFAELGAKFGMLVDILSEISETSGFTSNRSTLRTYELWLKTGSERARRSLERSGIVPLPTSGTNTSH